jgi:hypothetical protein
VGDKLWYLRAKDYYLAAEGQEIFTQATTWKDLKIIVLSERGQTEKDC